MKTILIIGAGFCGAVTAVQLLRQAGHGGVRILLLNRSGPMARGLAYGTQSPHHVLNVPAGNMSALDGDPDHFLAFARSHDPHISTSSFVSRRLYGDYLEHLLDQAARGCTGAASLARIHGDVLALRPNPGRTGTGARAVLASAEVLAVDCVVLAFGHFPARQPAIADPAFYASARYLRDPWDSGAIAAIGPDAPVVLLGAGLTAIDVATSLLDAAPTRPLHLVSRHGLLPKAHRSGQAAAWRGSLPALFFAPAPGVRALLHSFRAHVRAMEQAGEDWRDAFGALRPLTARLWHGLSDAERRRFLRHVQPFWDNHRHRAAPATHARVAAAIQAGTVRVLAGRVLSCDQHGPQVALRLRPRHGGADITLRASHVVNCIGPASDLASVSHPLVEQLLRDGLIDADRLGLGLAVAANGAVLGADRRASPWLFYVGPLLKARDWEATAVPELRRFAAHLASTLLARSAP